MTGIAGRIEPDSQHRPLDDVGDRLAAQPVAGLAAVERRKDRTGGDASRLEPALEGRHRAGSLAAS